MTTVIRAAGAADFLALVPRLLGFVPERSVVLVPFTGNRTIGALRLDLPTSVDREEIERTASTFIGLVCKVAHVDAVAVVVFTDTRIDGAEALPHDALVSALLTRADLCGLRASEALCLAPDAWGSYLDPDLPSGGHSRGLIPFDDPAFADLPVHRGGQSAGAALPVSDLAERERVRRALGRLASVMRALASDVGAPEPDPGLEDDEPWDAEPWDEEPWEDDADGAGGGDSADHGARGAASGILDLHVARLLLEDPPLLFEDALEWDRDQLLAEQLAALLWALSRPGLRDVALVQWATELERGDEVFDAQQEWARGEPFPAELGQIIWGEGARPDGERLRRALELARHAVAAAPRRMRPGALAACAWLAWALGRSTHAAAYANQALEIDPDQRMAQIVRTYVDAAHLPEWAYDRPRPPRGPATRLVDSAGVEGPTSPGGTGSSRGCRDR